MLSTLLQQLTCGNIVCALNRSSIIPQEEGFLIDKLDGTLTVACLITAVVTYES